ncbi:hypothetical protein Tco_0656923 [Tanacetum coccineum]|uniref:Uncharacterized protein n=1 Tax=Tanacetum coccineum TaxID=301880 RepID=A0ABQ4XA50_9ASTR
MTYPYLWFSEQVGLAGDLGSTNNVLIPLILSREVSKLRNEVVYMKSKHSEHNHEISKLEASMEKARNDNNIKGNELVKDLHADNLKMAKELDLLREFVKVSESSRKMLEEEATRLRPLLKESEALCQKCRGCEDKEATKSSLYS